MLLNVSALPLVEIPEEESEQYSSHPFGTPKEEIELKAQSTGRRNFSLAKTKDEPYIKLDNGLLLSKLSISKDSGMDDVDIEIEPVKK